MLVRKVRRVRLHFFMQKSWTALGFALWTTWVIVLVRALKSMLTLIFLFVEKYSPLWLFIVSNFCPDTKNIYCVSFLEKNILDSQSYLSYLSYPYYLVSHLKKSMMGTNLTFLPILPTITILPFPSMPPIRHLLIILFDIFFHRSVKLICHL